MTDFSQQISTSHNSSELLVNWPRIYGFVTDNRDHRLIPLISLAEFQRKRIQERKFFTKDQIKTLLTNFMLTLTEMVRRRVVLGSFTIEIIYISENYEQDGYQLFVKSQHAKYYPDYTKEFLYLTELTYRSVLNFYSMMGFSLPLAELKGCSEFEDRDKYQAFQAILTFTLQQIKSVKNYRLTLFKTFGIIKYNELKTYQQPGTDISFVEFMPRFSDQSGQMPVGAVIKGTEEDDGYELREVKLLEKFSHPNLCQLYEYIRYDKYVILFLKQYQGTLMDLAEQKGLTIPAKVKIMKSIAQALLELHSFDVIHRDLKPENIMYSRLSGKQIEDADFIIIDFDRSYSKLKSRALSTALKPTFYEGTEMYAPPEVGSSDKYFASYDVFQLGMIFLEIILVQRNEKYGMCQFKNDRKKFEELNGRDQIKKKLREFEKQNNVKIPERLEEIILQMISYEAEARPTLNQVLEQLINIQY